MVNVLLILSGTLSGLLAGLLYGFSVAVIPGLRVVPPKQHILAMQAMNAKIKNLMFLLIFMGPTVLFPLIAYLEHETSQFPYLVAAALLHILGVNGITFVGNIPLNDALDRVNVSTISDADAEKIRNDFHGNGSRWMQLHHIRTIASIAATVLIFVVCLSEVS